jgi:predicted RNase H-like HicB family nuclease
LGVFPASGITTISTLILHHTNQAINVLYFNLLISDKVVTNVTMKVKTNTKVLKFRVPIIVEPDGDGFYAHSPALSGLMMDGDTKEEALQNARDGATVLLQSMIRDGDPIH